MGTKADIPFFKMQGSGNDFVVIDNRDTRFSLEELIELTPKLCDRKYGVGADGLMALQKPRNPDTDYEMLYRNADGSDAGMCGNGSRCLALFASKLGMGTELAFNVHEKIYTAHVQDQQEISVDFPFSTHVKEITIDNYSHALYQVFTGTEHIVKETDREELKDEEQLYAEGKKLRDHSHFQPKGTNVNFFSGLNAESLELQTYERGVENLTLACGTGAIAAGLAWHHIQQLKTSTNEFLVQAAGGALKVGFSFDASNKTYKNIRLTGPADIVFEGTYYA